MDNESKARLDKYTKTKNKTRILSLPYVFNIVLRVLAKELRRKEKKSKSSKLEKK